VFNQVTQTGTVTKLNPELENLIRSKFRDKENPIEGKWAKTEDEDELVRKVTAYVGRDRGSVQNLSLLTDKEKEVFKTALEINQTDLIRLAAHRQEFIDQTQSLNLFYDSSKTPLAQMLHDVLLAHSLGVCTLYYNRGVQSEKRDKVGEKIEKVNLESLLKGNSPVFDDSSSEQIDVVISSVDDCMACEG
jgi:ribonucleoside-diphosphate reductase alpha chain